MKKNLAIIIPAYKPDYLKDTLTSLELQTNKDFKVYIGDDASPHSLQKIVSQFKDTLDISYIKFEDNLGSVSLAKQWQRCVELSSEEWIWLFSDDDVMSPTAVMSFNKAAESKPNSRLFKFHTKMIGADGEVMRLFRDKTNVEKNKILPATFITKRLRNDRFRSYMVEYVFRRDIYTEFGFVDFPLAWAADDATWLLYAIANDGIDVINDVVYWRFSGVNISSDNKRSDEKIRSAKIFINWLLKINAQNNLHIKSGDMLTWLFAQMDIKSDVKPDVSDFNDFFTERNINSAYKKYLFSQKMEVIKNKLKKIRG